MRNSHNRYYGTELCDLGAVKRTGVGLRQQGGERTCREIYHAARHDPPGVV